MIATHESMTFGACSRRRFLALAAAVPFTFDPGLRAAVAATDAVTVDDLVHLLEGTPRARVIEEIANRIHAGLAPEQLIAALLVAGSRNIAARPHVGYKYHAIMGLQSVWLAAGAQTGMERWLPLLWAVDYYKAAERRDREQADWILPPLDDAQLPPIEHAHTALINALNEWELAAADAAVTRLARAAPLAPLFDVLFRYGVRDFRDIGHKAIAVANCHRLLAVTEHGAREPALRSLIRALQNHHGERNPASSATPTARAWRNNQLPTPARQPTFYAPGDMVPQVLAALRTTESEVASRAFADFWKAGVPESVLLDGVLLGAAELMLQRRNFIAMHAMTMSEAAAYAYAASGDTFTQRLLLCQAAAQLAAFRALLNLGDDDPSLWIDTLEAGGSAEGSVGLAAIFESLARDRLAAARQILGYRVNGGPVAPLLTTARNYAIAKTTEVHDYKFTEAVIAGYTQVSSRWRDRWLAAGACWFNTPGDPDNVVIAHARTALS